MGIGRGGNNILFSDDGTPPEDYFDESESELWGYNSIFSGRLTQAQKLRALSSEQRMALREQTAKLPPTKNRLIRELYGVMLTDRLFPGKDLLPLEPEQGMKLLIFIQESDLDREEKAELCDWVESKVALA